MNRKISIILCCAAGSLIIISFLYILSPQPNRHKNGFNRIITKEVLHNPKQIDIEYNSYYIAGISDQNIFLANSTAPAILLIIDRGLQNKRELRIKLSSGQRIRWPSVRIAVDSNKVFLMDGITPSLYSGTINDSVDVVNNWHVIISDRFSKGLPLFLNRYVLRVYDTTLHQNILISAGKHKQDTFILDKQVDGMFCTDGMFAYDKAAGRLIYSYYYRNRFSCLDTGLQLIYTARTIDTTNFSNIKLDTLPKSKMVTFSAPPLMVNEKASVSGNFIFIHSALKADNELEKNFTHNAIIDVYSSKYGNYLSSFYLPDFQEETETDFRVCGNTLFALFGRHLLAFTLDTTLFSLKPH